MTLEDKVGHSNLARDQAALRARVVELETAIATALQHLEKGRALWNGPSHQCSAVLRAALGIGEQSADHVQAWREQAQFWEDQTAALRAENAELVAVLTAALPYVVHSIKNDPDAPWMRGLPIEPAEAVRRKIKAALAAAGHKQGDGKMSEPDILYLVQLRASAIEQKKKDSYTWMSPEHVIRLLDAFEEKRVQNADLVAALAAQRERWEWIVKTYPSSGASETADYGAEARGSSSPTDRI